MTNLNSLTIHEILLLFPQRLHVEFALYCAKSCKPKDKQELKCIELVEKWLVDSESVTKSKLEAAADTSSSAHSAAYSAAHAAAYSADSAHAAARAAANAARAARAAHAAHAAAYSARSAAYSAAEEELKLYLINMIEERYTELELILMEVI